MMARAVTLASRAATELLQDAVIGDGFANHGEERLSPGILGHACRRVNAQPSYSSSDRGSRPLSLCRNHTLPDRHDAPKPHTLARATRSATGAAFANSASVDRRLGVFQAKLHHILMNALFPASVAGS
jgi:hypothetical protein